MTEQARRAGQPARQRRTVPRPAAGTRSWRSCTACSGRTARGRFAVAEAEEAEEEAEEAAAAVQRAEAVAEAMGAGAAAGLSGTTSGACGAAPPFGRTGRPVDDEWLVMPNQVRRHPSVGPGRGRAGRRRGGAAARRRWVRV